MLVGLVGGYLLILAAVTVLQRKLQYFPDGADPPAPTALIPTLRDLTLEASDGTKLRAWYLPGNDPATLLVLHGNAGHRGHRLAWFRQLHRRGWGVFLLDYRGYGGSEGSPNQKGLIEDAQTAHDWIVRETKTPVVLFGESLGCSVALHLAATQDVAALVLQSGGVDLGQVAADAYPFLPVRSLMWDRFNSTPLLADMTTPALVIHGKRDRTIRMEHGRAIFDGLGGPKEWLTYDAGHNDLTAVGGVAYVGAVSDFLRGTLKMPKRR